MLVIYCTSSKGGGRISGRTQCCVELPSLADVAVERTAATAMRPEVLACRSYGFCSARTLCGSNIYGVRDRVAANILVGRDGSGVATRGRARAETKRENGIGAATNALHHERFAYEAPI